VEIREAHRYILILVLFFTVTKPVRAAVIFSSSGGRSVQSTQTYFWTPLWLFLSHTSLTFGMFFPFCLRGPSWGCAIYSK